MAAIRRAGWLWVGAVVVLAVLAGACGGDDEEAVPSTGRPEQPTSSVVEAYDSADGDLCDWVSEDEVTEFVANEFDWDGNAIEVEQGVRSVCEWELTGTGGDSGWVDAGTASSKGLRFNPEEVTVFDGGTIGIGAWVIGHSALDPGVVVHNGAYGRFYFGVPPDGELLALSLQVPAVEWDAEYEARYFAVANHFLEDLGWSPDQ